MVFLVSDESSFVNVVDFVVDGGLIKVYVILEGFVIEVLKNVVL